MRPIIHGDKAMPKTKNRLDFFISDELINIGAGHNLGSDALLLSVQAAKYFKILKQTGKVAELYWKIVRSIKYLSCDCLSIILVKALMDQRSKVRIITIPPKNVDNFPVLHLGLQWEGVPYF